MFGSGKPPEGKARENLPTDVSSTSLTLRHDIGNTPGYFTLDLLMLCDLTYGKGGSGKSRASGGEAAGNHDRIAACKVNGIHGGLICF